LVDPARLADFGEAVELAPVTLDQRVRLPGDAAAASRAHGVPVVPDELQEFVIREQRIESTVV